MGPPCDIFALGVVVYEMYRFNLDQAPRGKAHTSLIPIRNNAVPEHQIALDASIVQFDTHFLPPSMVQLISRILTNNADMRANAIEIINNPCFGLGTLAVLRTIDTLGSKDIGTQASQLNLLPSLLVDCPPRLLEGPVLLTISKLCLNSPGLWVYALPIFGNQSVN